MQSKTTILLTCTVNINPTKSWVFQRHGKDRFETYMKSITQWLTKTNFTIVVVENSGFDFKPLLQEQIREYSHRLEIIGFRESDVAEAAYLKNNDSKGASEVFAIQYALSRSRFMDEQQTNFVIKVTGRFFIPELESYLSQFDLSKYDCLTQNNRSECQMVGSHIKNVAHIFAIHLRNQHNQYDGHIENIWHYRTSCYPNIIVCKPFAIEPTQQGGINRMVTII